MADASVCLMPDGVFVGHSKKGIIAAFYTVNLA